MGKVKDYLQDLDNASEIIEDFYKIINSEEFQKHVEVLIDWNRYLNFTELIFNEVSEIYRKQSIDIDLVSFILNDVNRLNVYSTEILKGGSQKFLINLFLKEFDEIINLYKNLKRNFGENYAINTDDYYDNKIKELEQRESELKQILNQPDEITQDEIFSAKFEAEEANRKLNELRKELEAKKRQEDAKENWKQNIVETFNNLKTYLKPIKNEQRRLNVLFWVYLLMSTLLVIAVIIIEWTAVGHIGLMKELPDFKTYILIYLPLPVAGALLWGFIYQMNRAQRQLVVIAKSIHKVEYVQGLLLSINKLAPNVEDGITRINAALDKLINNHLNEKEVNTEEDIIKEEKKDVVPVDTLIRLLKEVKGVVGKE